MASAHNCAAMTTVKERLRCSHSGRAATENRRALKRRSPAQRACQNRSSELLKRQLFQVIIAGHGADRGSGEKISDQARIAPSEHALHGTETPFMTQPL